MMRWNVGLAVGGMVLAAVGGDRAWGAPSARTNLVLIMTDDQGAWSLGSYGNPEARTQAVDKLAAEGVRFTNAFATTPVCSPSRATFVTGRIPSQHGIHDWIKSENSGDRSRYCLDQEVLLSSLLVQAGYACGLVGKWHMGDSRGPHAGYSYWFAIMEGSSPYNDAELFWQGTKIKTTGYLTDRITDRAIEFMDTHKGEPFFLHVAYNAPHSPYEGHPQELVDQFATCPFGSVPHLPAHPWSSGGAELIGDHKVLSQYFAACSGVSRGVDRIVKHLTELGLAENTLVIYTSDQGFCCGHHGLWGKGNASNPRNMYDTSLQIPLIFRQPGKLQPKRVVDALFSAYDFVPTVLDYLGLPPSPGRNLPGSSLVPALRGERQEGPEAVFGEYGRARMIRTAKYKYVHRADGGPDELYDLEADPSENRNLVDVPEHRPLMVKLRTRLFKWFEKYAEAGSDPVGQEYLRPADRK